MKFDPLGQRWQLHQAAADGDLARVEALVERKYPLNRFDHPLGWTPLHYAAEYGHLAVVDRLIEAGADVNANYERLIGETPLGTCIENCTYAMAERLILAGADPTIPGWMQITALDRAAGRTDADAERVRRLLEGAAARLRNAKR